MLNRSVERPLRHPRQQLDRVIAGLVAQVDRALDVDVASVAVLNKDARNYRMTAHAGARSPAYRNLEISPGAGLGGLVADIDQAVQLEDYLTAREITDDYRAAVSEEGVRGFGCVPVRGPEGAMLLLYAGNRSVGGLGDRAFGRLEGLAAAAQESVNGLRDLDERIWAAVLGERRQIVGELHETIAQVLFAIAVTADTGDRGALGRIADLARDGRRDLGRSLARLGGRTPPPANDAPLTAREQETLCLVAEGLSNLEIARRLHVAESTVKWHLRQLMTKLGAPSRWRAVVIARERGLI